MKESGIGRENGVEAFEACKFILELADGSCLIYAVARATQIRRASQLL
jgi:hypothetical protein